MSWLVTIQSVPPFYFAVSNVRPTQKGMAQTANKYKVNNQVYGVSFKKRAPRAIKAIKEFATLHMVSLLFPISRTANWKGTKDVRVDPQLNKKVWERGIKTVPHRMRLRLSRKRNDEEGATEKLYTYVEAVNVKDVRGLQTVVVEA